MSKEELENIKNELDELMSSFKKEQENNIPEMQKVFFDNEKPIVFKEKTEEEIKLQEEIEKEKIKEEVIEEPKKEKKKKNKKDKAKKKSKKWVITFGILDVLAIVCIFLMYGPIAYFRNLWVTSAMTTMSHKYLAYIFFNQEQIDDIMSNNTIIEVEGETNQEDIKFEEEQPEEIVYSSPEEEQILTRDEGNDVYKVIDIEGDGYKGHMLVVYDPSKIELFKVPNMKYGWTLDQFMNKTGAVAGINASGFIYSDYTGYTLTGTVIQDGQVIADNGGTGWGGGIIGFTNDNVLVLTKASSYEALNMGIRDAVSFGPFLIVNGVPSQFKGNGGYGIAPRTAIGQRKDGIVLMLVIDGRRPGHSLGVDMVELTNIMLKYGAYNASNLDGGGSSTFYANGKILSVAGGAGYSGDRYLPNAWLVYE